MTLFSVRSSGMNFNELKKTVLDAVALNDISNVDRVRRKLSLKIHPNKHKTNRDESDAYDEIIKVVNNIFDYRRNYDGSPQTPSPTAYANDMLNRLEQNENLMKYLNVNIPGTVPQPSVATGRTSTGAPPAREQGTRNREKREQGVRNKAVRDQVEQAAARERHAGIVEYQSLIPEINSGIQELTQCNVVNSEKSMLEQRRQILLSEQNSNQLDINNLLISINNFEDNNRNLLNRKEELENKHTEYTSSHNMDMMGTTETIREINNEYNINTQTIGRLRAEGQGKERRVAEIASLVKAVEERIVVLKDIITRCFTINAIVNAKMERLKTLENTFHIQPHVFAHGGKRIKHNKKYSNTRKNKKMNVKRRQSKRRFH